MTATPEPIDRSAMSQHPTMASFFVRILTDHCASEGLPMERLFHACGLDPATLDDPEQRFSLRDFLRLCEFAATELDDPCLGLGIGARMSADYLGPYGFALMSCNTPREMMAQAERYSVLAIGGGSNVFEERAGEWISYWRHAEAEATPGWRIMDELVMASAVTMARTLFGQEELAPNWASFRSPPPADPAPYEALFRCPLRFDSDAYAIAFDARYLDLEIRRGHPQLRAQLNRLCEELLARLADERDPDWLRRCRSLIVSSLETPPPDLSRIAAQLEIAPSTLRRRLAERSTSFRGLVDEIRQELAVAYLQNQELSLVDVAYLLGFSEQSAFQRAFKRWMDMTPGEYRLARRGGSPG